MASSASGDLIIIARTLKMFVRTFILICLAASACGEGGRQDAGPVDAPASGDTLDFTNDVLEAAAADVIAFLRGAPLSERVQLADTVVLRISPEGGGARRALDRGSLREPANWVVVSNGQRYSLVPPRELTKTTTRAGSHFNCMEYPLSSRFPELAPLPHAGVKLEPDASSSCLQSWNVTFVFDSAARPPMVVAAVYDQWEW